MRDTRAEVARQGSRVRALARPERAFGARDHPTLGTIYGPLRGPSRTVRALGMTNFPGSGVGHQPVSGQVIIDTANTILGHCSHTCGSYGTNTAGCSSCHVTLNYRA